MTREEKLKLLEQLSQNPRVTDFNYNDEILEDEREDSIWYDGWLVCFVLDNRFEVTFMANGEIQGWLTVGNEERRIRNGNVVEELLDYGISKDSDICYDYSYQDEPTNAKCSIDLGLNNWFEFEIINKETDENITEAFGTDVVCDYDDMFRLIEIADDYIESYYND